MDDNYFGQKDDEGNLIEVAKLLEDYFTAIKGFNEEEFNLNEMELFYLVLYL